jgi:hypothetical protein
MRSPHDGIRVSDPYRLAQNAAVVGKHYASEV